MQASLKFKDAIGEETTELREVRIVTFEDSKGNKYTLDTSGDLKLNYVDTDSSKNYDINNLSDIVSKLTGSSTFKTAILHDGSDNPITTVSGLITQLKSGDNDDGVYTKEGVDNAFVKTDGSNIETQADKGKALVDALVPKLATVGTDDTKKVYTQKGVDDAFIKTSEFTTKVTETAFAGAILGAKDGKKSILVDKLEGFLGAPDKVYSGDTKTAKELLVSSVADLAAELAKSTKFIDDIEKMAASSNPKFQGAVREVMSQPVFEIPAGDDTPLSWDWI